MAENEMNRNGNGGNTNKTGSGMNDRSTRGYGLITLVAPEDGTPVAPGSDMENVPALPIAPKSGAPAFPGNGGAGIPAPPIAPEGNRPIFPGPDSTPVPSITPEEGRPVAPGPGVSIPGFPLFPSLPTVPSYPSPQYFSQVRFLNVSTNSFPVNTSVDNTTYAVNPRFGTVSNYDWIAGGFHTVTAKGVIGLRSILFQQTFPFMVGIKATMALTDTPPGGLSMMKVTDIDCISLPFNAGYHRFANITYGSSSSGLLLYGGEAVFCNVSFREVASCKQVMADSYQFYVINSSNFSIIRETPVIVISAYANDNMVNELLLSLRVDITANRNCTAYMTSNTWSDNSLCTPTVED